MRKLIVTEYWHDPEQMKYKLDETLEADDLLLGRVTYESFAAAWPERDGEFADKMNRMAKHVVSTTRGRVVRSSSPAAAPSRTR